MAFTKTIPYNFRYLLATKEIDLENDDFHAYLMTSSLTYDPATHLLYSDISSYLINNTNASAIRLRDQLLTKGTISNPSGQLLKLPFDALVLDPDVGEDLPAFMYVFIVDVTATDDPIVCVVTFDADQTILGDELVKLENMYIQL